MVKKKNDKEVKKYEIKLRFFVNGKNHEKVIQNIQKKAKEAISKTRHAELIEK